MSSSVDLALERPADCPPDDAIEPSGEFYRLTRRDLAEGDVPGDDDWIVPFQKRKGECAGCADRCDCHAHSVFQNLDDLQGARHANPWVRKKSVASVKLEPTSGAIRRSGTDLLPSHHDWWPAEPGVAPDAVVVKGAAE